MLSDAIIIMVASPGKTLALQLLQRACMALI